jgi:hypothetical protein
VPTAGATYMAELGYYDQDRLWKAIAVSDAVKTYAAEPGPAAEPVFASVSLEPEPVSMPVLPSEVFPGTSSMTFPAADAVHHGVPLPTGPRFEDFGIAAVETAAGAPVSQQASIAASPEVMRRTGLASPEAQWHCHEAGRTPVPPPPTIRSWTPEEAGEILQITGITTSETRAPVGSVEIVDLLKRFMQHGIGISSLEAVEFGLEAGAAPEEAVTSPGAPPVQAAPPGFWFNVNAELVIYGATERDATVTIGGRRIRLRPDGSFSYRFALPDGAYELPIRAVAAYGDVRAANLSFSRTTNYQGEVGAHPQDGSLTPPSPENIPPAP